MYGWRAENKGGEGVNYFKVPKTRRRKKNQKGDSHVRISAKLLYRTLKPFKKPLIKREKKWEVSIQANYIQAPRKGNNFYFSKKMNSFG